MSNTLFDLSGYKRKAPAHTDWRDATGFDPYWDAEEPLLETTDVNSSPILENQDLDSSMNNSQPEVIAQPPEQVEEIQSSVTKEVAVLEPLTPEEESERQQLELRVERAFYEAGTSLRELRDRRLYRSTHKTFEEYCRQRFAFSRITAHLKIAAAAVVENLLTNGKQILPTSERQVRELSTLSQEQQCQAWDEALSVTGGKVPTGRVVKAVVQRLKSKSFTKAIDCYQKGDVFTLTGLVAEERKYNGCWAIAVAVNEFSVSVDVHDGKLIVKPDNLNRIDSPDTRRQLPEILRRIRNLRDLGFLDRGAYNVLEDLGRQTYLTPVEEKLLECLEQHYGVDRSQVSSR